ncbi:MAG: sugar transferase [Dehalococcoidia bacterium]|nr:sugar transferase [Dehalococcoidia bacterium]|tara:strand:+ start:44 stop:667 length:624 start_codon:yes stop_codon:yes gene_type:complete
MEILRPKEYKLKRILDLSMILGGFIFPLLWPFWLIVIFVVPPLIWLEDRGPIFYSQDRIGKNKKIFKVMKFRTMTPDAEKITGAVWSKKDDPRITRIGRLLRITAIDEIPQIINIIKGEMSFVGPRAERPELHEKFVLEINDFDKRLEVTPGLSGLAQIKGSYDLEPKEKLKFDMEYSEKMSLFFDLKIILTSVFNSLSARWDRPDR